MTGKGYPEMGTALEKGHGIIKCLVADKAIQKISFYPL